MKLKNLTIVLVILIVIVLGCKNSNNSNGSNNSVIKKIIGGSVFPANEVCNYPRGSILDKYGILFLKWEKDNESKNPNAVYFCSPTDKKVKIVDSPNNIEILLDYDAWGNNSQGPYVIKIEYWARANDNTRLNDSIRLDAEQNLRTKILIPYCKDITKKAFNTDLSKSIIEKLTNPKLISVKTTPFCEKTGNGFVCISSTIKQTDIFINFKMFASDESYQSFLNGDI